MTEPITAALDAVQKRADAAHFCCPDAERHAREWAAKMNESEAK